MFCSACGEAVSTGARFCRHCGSQVDSENPSPPRAGAASTAPALLAEDPRFAGFWIRTLAYAIDWVIIFFAGFLFILFLVITAGPSLTAEEMDSVGATSGQLFGLVLAWLYFTVAEDG